MKNRELSRREFVRLSTVAGAGIVLSGGSAFAAKAKLTKKNIQEDKMSYVPLGRTKMLVSRLSLGGIPWSPNVARAAIDRGCNLVHGSIRYGKGRTIFEQGETLKGLWDKVFFILKGNVDDENVNTALKALGRDYVDMILPVFGSPQKVANPQVLEDFKRLKKAGKVRFLGMTVHSREPLGPIVAAGVKAGFYDAVLTMYQPARKDELIPVLKKARARGMGTLSMKTLQGAGGGLESQAQIIEDALSNGEIDTVLKGMGTFEMFEAFSKVAAKQKSARLGRPGPGGKHTYVVDRSTCGGCGSCARVCQGGLDLPEIMRCVTYYASQCEDHARETYREIPRHLTVAACRDCGQCEQACPRGLPIRKLIRRADSMWGTA